MFIEILTEIMRLLEPTIAKQILGSINTGATRFSGVR